MKSLSLETLLLIGAFGAVVIITLSALNWRRAVYAAFIVALFEGAIRKWILPQASELIYFLKDIILLGAYLRFYLAPDPEVRSRPLRIPDTIIATICFLVCVTGALNPNIGSVILAAYGIKIYIWYLPLAFMMPYLFRNEAEMIKVLFRYSLFAIPICLLGMAQFVAGPTSWLNVYARSSFAEMQHVATFGAGSERARITGTFSYITGFSTFIIFFFGIALGLLNEVTQKHRWVLLMVIMTLLSACALMAGSRGAVFSILIIASILSLFSTVSRVGKGTNNLIYLILAAGIVMAVVNVFFSDAFNAFETRRRTTGDTTIERLMYPVNSVLKASQEVGLSGFGIGMSHPASEALRNALKIAPSKKQCPVYDAETGQVLAELGWPGFLMWYFLRCMIVFHCWEAFKKSRPSTYKSLALIFFAFNAINLVGSVVLNHTANLFTFATWGFCLIPKLTPLASRKDTTSLENRSPGEEIENTRSRNA